jgi:hypothetical protein
MRRELILEPMGALALLTLFVLVLMLVRRVRAVGAGDISVEDFRYGESARVPGRAGLVNLNYRNLFEMPVLFYVICLIHYAAGAVETASLALSWAYVALRAAHTAVHVTYNHVFHRMMLFGASTLVLVALWASFFARLP